LPLFWHRAGHARDEKSCTTDGELSTAIKFMKRQEAKMNTELAENQLTEKRSIPKDVFREENRGCA